MYANYSCFQGKYKYILRVFKYRAVALMVLVIIGVGNGCRTPRTIIWLCVLS